MQIFKTSFLIICILSFTACKEQIQNPDTSQDQELITTVELRFTDTLTGIESVFSFRDSDGIGGMDPEIDTILLSSGGIYHCGLRFLDESDPQDVEDITEEIRNELADHHICFAGLLSLNIDVYIDPAANGGFNVPLQSIWTCNSQSNGSLRVQLMHKESHSHQDCDEGETDADLTFPLIVE